MSEGRKQDRTPSSGSQEPVDERALLAKDDPEAFEALLLDYRPFLLAHAARVCGRAIDPDNDDEYSVTLLAFYEAVRSYDPSRGAFLPFARSVVRSRLLDSFRRDGRRLPDLSIDDGYEDEDGYRLDPTTAASADAFAQDVQARERRDEILRFSQELSTWGFTFRDLAAASPKAAKTRDACGRLVFCMLEDATLVRVLRETRQLPVGALCQRTDIPRKIADRHRRFIVSAVLVLTGDYPYMAEHLKWMRNGK